MPPLLFFYCATLLPVPLLALAALTGGTWVWLALAAMLIMVYALDQIVAYIIPPTPEAEFPAGTVLAVVLGVAHFVLLVLILRSYGSSTLSLFEKFGLTIAAGLYFGQVSNANAHELVHRSRRGLHQLGMWIYISLLFGHHTSAHVLVHHRLVATRDDPASARLGEGYYAYVLRAWRGAFQQGYAAEAARLDRVGRSFWNHPYLVYGAGSVMMLIAAFIIGGAAALIGYLLLCLYAQMQLLLSDYVQHYGLQRELREDGRMEPVGAQHSWNSPHWFSSALMLNAPRHSDHHAHPAKHFQELELPADSPTLPRSLPAMASLALFPPLWHRVMDKRARAWATA